MSPCPGKCFSVVNTPQPVKDEHNLELYDNNNYNLEIMTRELLAYRVYRDDILLQVRINFTQAVFGDKINVPTVDGKANLKIPSGIEAGQILRIRNKGFPRLRRSGRGDQLIKIQIDVPKKLASNEKTVLKEYQNINKDRDVKFEKFDD